MADLRIGILGAARIAPAAVVRPARAVKGVTISAIAARDRGRAETFAHKHGIQKVHDSYQALLDDPDIDAIYNPLPNGLHGRYTKLALDAGKHVLCEKPFTANADEARDVASYAASGDRVVFEAFHYRYHPLMKRATEIIASGELGTITNVDVAMCIPLPSPKDIRFNLDLAGGATMDIGCYAIHLLRTLSGEEPRAISAFATTLRPGIDRAMKATYTFDSGATGSTHASLLSKTLLRLSAKVTGTNATMTLFNPLGPQARIGPIAMHRLSVTGGNARHEQFSTVATYSYQMEAFVNAVTKGAPFVTTPQDAILTMEVIDSLYALSGLGLRQPTP